jgi:hypothetical protein
MPSEHSLASICQFTAEQLHFIKETAFAPISPLKATHGPLGVVSELGFSIAKIIRPACQLDQQELQIDLQSRIHLQPTMTTPSEGFLGIIMSL